MTGRRIKDHTKWIPVANRSVFNEICAQVSEKLIIRCFAAFDFGGDQNMEIRQAILSEALVCEEHIMNGEHARVPSFLLVRHTHACGLRHNVTPRSFVPLSSFVLTHLLNNPCAHFCIV